MMVRRASAGWAMVTLASITLGTITLASVNAAGSAPECKPVSHYGVNGCELLPGQTCPAGHHKQAVGPSNPQMMGPTYLMCVPDKPPAKEEPPKSTPEAPAKPDGQKSPD